MTSQRDDEVLVIFTPFLGHRKISNASEGHIFRPNLTAHINISKALENYMNRCKCTDSRDGIGLVVVVGRTSVFSFL